MLPNVNIGKIFPDAYKAYAEVERHTAAAAEEAGLSKIVAELVKIRVSQLNGCAFCLRMHTRDAIEAGETADRLAVLPAWWESQYFSEQEQGALTLAERLTRIGDEHTSPTPDIDVEDALSEQQIAAITWIVVAINGWNRIAIASHYPVAP
jgi:AhpD family alkylhydroperoxidase